MDVKVIRVREASRYTTKSGRKCTLIIDADTNEYYYDFGRKPEFYDEFPIVKLTLRNGSKIVDKAEPATVEEQSTIEEAVKREKTGISVRKTEGKGKDTSQKKDDQIAKLSVLRAILTGIDREYLTNLQTNESITIAAENIVRLWEEVVKLAKKKKLI